MPKIQKYHQYKVYRNNVYLGDLPLPSNPFSYAHDINTAGTQITINCPTSVDNTNQSPNYIAAEDGTILTAEDVTYLTTERQEEVFGDGSDKSLFRNGNKLIVWEFSSYWPNGKKVFSGRIQRCEAVFGSTISNEGVNVYAYSDGQELSNYVIPGSNSLFLDQQQTTTDNTLVNAGFSGWFLIGGIPKYSFMIQSFKTGAVSNLAAIELKLVAYYGQTVTVNIYASPPGSPTDTPLATTSLSVTGTADFTTINTYTFTLATPLTVTPSTTYYFSIVSGFTGPQDPMYDIYIVEANTNGAYANGQLYTEQSQTGYRFSNWGTYIGGVINTTNADSAYFKTYYSAYTTKRIFTAVDPTTIVSTILATYLAQGGQITANVLTLTSLVVNYTFQLATIFEGIQVAISLAGPNYYWYVDVGLNQLNFKKASTTADIKLTKGVHIEQIKLVVSTENVKNLLYFTGGPTLGINLFKTYTNQQSITDNGVQLDRPSDNRVTLDATADIIGNAEIAALKSQQYQTQVTVLDQTMDITLFKPGQTIGFNGFGSFADQLILRIVRIDYASDHVVLTLGSLPPRQSDALQQVINDVTALQTIDNPNSPS